MKKNVLKSGIVRLCLMSFILLCNLFMCEHAFSKRDWSDDDAQVIYDPKDKSITFTILCYDYWGDQNRKSGWLRNCDFLYSEDGKQYNYLMNINTKEQGAERVTSLKMSIKKPFEKIQLLNSYTPDNLTMVPSDGSELNVTVKPMYLTTRKRTVTKDLKRSYLEFKWELPQTAKQIHSIQVMGSWLAGGKNIDKINSVFTNQKAKSISVIPTELTSEMSDNVKVTGKADAINVAGAEPGEQIKVYTLSGVEVKSVVANDDVVNINLPQNHIYIVKAGLSRNIVAL